MPVTTVTLLPYALGSVDDVARYLKLQTVPTQDEAQMFKRVINAATLKVETYCGRPFIARSLNETYDGNGKHRLYLRAMPVVSVTQIDWLDHQGDSYKTYAASDLRVDLPHGIVMLKEGGKFTRGLQNWQVQYSASYGTLADVPDDVVLGFLKLCAEYWRDYGNRKDDIVSQTVDGQTTFYNNDLVPPKIKSLLKPHAIPAGMVNL